MDIRKLIKECVIEVLKEGLQPTPENPKDALYVEYHSQRKGEEPFMLGERKFEYVNGKYPDGKVDIAVYAFAGDLCYGYNAFREMMNLKEGFDPQSNGGPNPEATSGLSTENPYPAWNNKMRRMENRASNLRPSNHPLRNAAQQCPKCKSPDVALPAYNSDWFDCVKCGHSWEMTPKQKEFMRTHPAAAYDKDGYFDRKKVKENMGRYAQLAGATDLKETLELTPTGQKDSWSRPIYKDAKGRIYVDINLGQGTPSIHDVTDAGEPLTPIRNFKIVGR